MHPSSRDDTIHASHVMEDGPERVVAVVVVVVYDLCREEDGDAPMLLLKKEEGYI